MNNELYQTCIKILNEELLVASGCTEPIAIALVSAKCCEVLGDFPEQIEVKVSGNMIKNAMGVTIPGTDDLQGIEYSALLGAIVKSSDKQLDLLNGLTKENVQLAKELKLKGICEIAKKDTEVKLYIEITMRKNSDEAVVELMHSHINFTKIVKNGENAVSNLCDEGDFSSSVTDRSKLSVENIIQFANEMKIEDMKEIFDLQIANNVAIAEEALKNDYGLSAGKIILEEADSVKEKMKGYCASGSDARMGGCDMPVVINCGSGNQGIVTGNGVYVYCKEKGISADKMYRGLAVANLIAIHIKSRIGRLSAFCGAISAGIGVGTAITYLEDGSLKNIENTIKNGIGDLAGVICDGAKCSCAIKIASSLDAAYLAHRLAMSDKVIQHGIGIINESVEKTIENLAVLARDAMQETDEMILDIMVKA